MLWKKKPQRTLAEHGEYMMRHVAKAAGEKKTSELEHMRFRDGDKSVKGGALLSFSGLMVAADLVFLSAGDGAFIPDNSPFGWGGFWALGLLFLGAALATWSIMAPGRISETDYDSTDEFFGAVSRYLESREEVLKWSAFCTVGGTFLFIVALGGSVLVSPPS